MTINTTIHVNNVVLISQNNGDYTPIHIDTVELVSQSNEDLFPSQDPESEMTHKMAGAGDGCELLMGNSFDLQGDRSEANQVCGTPDVGAQETVERINQDVNQIVVHTTDGPSLMATKLWPNLEVTSPIHTETLSLDQNQPEEMPNSQEFMEKSESDMGGRWKMGAGHNTKAQGNSGKGGAAQLWLPGRALG